MSKYPVTVAQYRVFAETNGQAIIETPRMQEPENHPVTNVTWQESLAYCLWLQRQLSAVSAQMLSKCRLNKDIAFWKGIEEGKLHTALPSEAEWEKAARGIDGRIYPWGTTFTGMESNYHSENPLSRTSTVGMFPLGGSPYGVFDLSGNIWEWTRTIWDFDKFRYPYDYRDGREYEDKDATHVLRGGDFDANHDYLRCAFRRYSPYSARNNYGFRVVILPFLMA